MNFKDLNNKALISDNDIDWEDLGAGVKRKIMAYDDNLMLVKVEFEKMPFVPFTITHIYK